MSLQITQEKKVYVGINIPIDDIDHVLDYSWLSYLSNYNEFYHPNLCHICKRTNDGNLIYCECRMISYCTEEHKQRHYREHQDLCKCLVQYFSEGNWHAMWRTYDDCEWMLARHTFSNIIINRFERPIISYEMTMLQFSKSCSICHRQMNLNCCQRCYSENYCSEHVLEFQERHVPFCDILLLSLNIEIIKLNTKLLHMGDILFPVIEHPTDDMNSFLIRHVRKFPYKELKSRTSIEYIYSNYLSTPLTIYEGLNKRKLLRLPNIKATKWVVHIITQNYMEYKLLPGWEILMHSLRYIKELIFVFIGEHFNQKNTTLETCQRCKKQGQKISCMSYGCLYEEYVNSSSYLQPNMILICHMDNKSDMRNTFNKLFGTRCPVFITSHNKYMVSVHIQIIKECLNKNPIYNKPSNFKSIVPAKDLALNEITYYNSYLIICLL